MCLSDRVVLIKDTLTSGTTLKANLRRLHDHCVSDVIVSVDRMERGGHYALSSRHEIERTHGIKIHAIVTLDDIVRSLEKRVVGGVEYLDAIKRYKEQYGGE